MGPEVFTIGLVLAAGVALLLIGAVSAWSAANVARRLGGLLAAMMGALIALAALGAPSPLLIAALAIVFAHVVIGVALLVRLQEVFAGIESPDLDVAARAADAAEGDE